MTLGTIFAVFGTFIALLFGFLFCKKLYYKYKLKKRFFIIPRIGTQGIASVGMVLALSISVILLLVICTAGIASLVFRLWAGMRLIFEGILIKIGGLLFGPVIGMCLGAAIDLLTITYTGGIFHYGYFISAVLFGLFGGLIRTIITSPRGSTNLKFSIYSTIISIALIAGSACLIWFTNDSSANATFIISLMGLDIPLKLYQIVIILCAIPLLALIILWVCYFVQVAQKRKNENAKDWFKYFGPVFIMIMISEVVVNVIFMPVFDGTLSPLPYQVWLAIRLLLLGPMILLNVVIILPVYKIINPLMKYSYEDELVEDLDMPIYIEPEGEEYVRKYKR